MEPICIMLVGIGGYGTVYVKGLLTAEGRRRATVVGAVDPYPAGEGYAMLEAEGIPVYTTVEALLAQHTPDLAIISSPTPFHEEQAIRCLEHGCHVLLEKPIAPTVPAAEAMIRARDASGRVLVIGYQWCFDETLLWLRAAVRAGELGAPRALRALVLWPRDGAYYRRGIGWAGRRYTADGRAAFDNVASNATAHYLMNMLWMAGYSEGDVDIAGVDARVARANDIEMFDTICLKVRLTNGADIAFAASHAVPRDALQNPMFSYAFERGVASFGAPGESGDRLTVALPGGEVRDLGSVSSTDVALRKVWHTLDIIAGRADNPCPPELAVGHTRVMSAVDGLYGGQFPAFAPDIVRETDGVRWVPGLAETLRAFYEDPRLPDTLP